MCVRRNPSPQTFNRVDVADWLQGFIDLTAVLRNFLSNCHPLGHLCETVLYVVGSYVYRLTSRIGRPRLYYIIISLHRQISAEF